MYVVVDPAVFDHLMGCGGNAEDVFFQRTISQMIIEAYYNCVFPGLATGDAVPTDTYFLPPRRHGMKCHSCPVIADGDLRLRLATDCPVHLPYVRLTMSDSQRSASFHGCDCSKCLAQAILRRHQTSLVFFDQSNDLFVTKSAFQSPSIGWTDQNTSA